MNSSIASLPHDGSAPSLDYSLRIDVSGAGKFLIWSCIISYLFLTQIAYNIGEFPVGPDFLFYLVTAAYLLLSGYARLNLGAFFLYVCIITLAAFRIPFSKSDISWSSFLLMCTLYAPFAFRLQRRSDLRPIRDYVMNAFVLAASAIAVIAIIQLILVNVLKVDFTNIYFYLPEQIRGAGKYTFLREGGGGLVKANGFFLRESADLSIVTALALLMEFHFRRRVLNLALLAGGVLASFSGTGMIALIAGFLLPRSVARIPIFVACAAAFLLLIYFLYSLDNPVLNLWFGRFSEFSTPNTSAYARYVGPLNMVQRGFENGLASVWLGNGGGSFYRELTVARLGYEVSDVAWAKLIYEYGFVGLVAMSTVVILRLYRSSLPAEVCNFLLFNWITVAYLLKPGFVLIIWLLTLVPAASPVRHQRPAAGDH